MHKVALALGMGCLLLGCPSVTTMTTARTMDQGKFQFTVAPEVFGAVATNSSAGTTSATVPQIEIAGRYAITDRFELGAKAWFIGFALDGKFALIRSPTDESGMDLSIDPGIGALSFSAGSGSGSASATTVIIYLPLLLGINVGGGHQLVFGPKLVDQVLLASASGSSAGANVIYIGTSVGFSIKIGQAFRILPELSLLYPVVGSDSSSSATLGGGFFVQGGVGFTFGSTTNAPAAAPPPAYGPPPPGPAPAPAPSEPPASAPPPPPPPM